MTALMPFALAFSGIIGPAGFGLTVGSFDYGVLLLAAGLLSALAAILSLVASATRAIAGTDEPYDGA